MADKANSKTKSGRKSRSDEETEAEATEKIEGAPFAALPGLTRTQGSGNTNLPEFVSIGFGSLVAINRVLTIIAPDSAPVRRLMRDARDQGLLVDATFGRKTKAVLLLDTGHVLIAALQPETILGRFEQKKQSS